MYSHFRDSTLGRREPVAFDRELRRITARVAADTRRMLRGGRTPPPDYEPRKCDACSLNTFCHARALEPGGVWH